MSLRVNAVAAAIACSVPIALWAQVDFKVAGRTIEMHSFFSQGFGYSDQNNYLTMKTGQGSAALTEGGVRVSMQVTDRLQVGAEVFDRNIGSLGRWRPQLSWAAADYRIRQWFGIRGGVVKTVFGLHNDTQELEFLRTNVLLPQSVYPADMQDLLGRHRGADVYGEIPLRRLGAISYTAYAGVQNDGRRDGYSYLLSGQGVNVDGYGGLGVGEDLRWRTALKGLLVGISHMGLDATATGSWTLSVPGQRQVTSYEEHSKRDWSNQFYGQYTRGGLRLEGEFRRSWRDQLTFSRAWEVTTDSRGWYVLGAYRLNKRLEIGGYYSRWTLVWSESASDMAQANRSTLEDHLYDRVVTMRLDLARFWNVKLEGHFMDGNGSPGMYPSGFYLQDNPQGLKGRTALGLVTTGFSF